MDADQRTIERARPYRHLSGILLHGGEQLFELFNRRGQVGVGEQHPLALGFQHTVPHRVPLAAVAGILQHAHGWMPPREFSGQADCPIL